MGNFNSNCVFLWRYFIVCNVLLITLQSSKRGTHWGLFWELSNNGKVQYRKYCTENIIAV